MISWRGVVVWVWTRLIEPATTGLTKLTCHHCLTGYCGGLPGGLEVAVEGRSRALVVVVLDGRAEASMAVTEVTFR